MDREEGREEEGEGAQASGIQYRHTQSEQSLKKCLSFELVGEASTILTTKQI